MDGLSLTTPGRPPPGPRRAPRAPHTSPSKPATRTLGDRGPRIHTSKQKRKPLSDDDARRIIIRWSRELGALRRNQGPQAQGPRWIRRTPEQMARLIEDDRSGQIHGKHVVAAIRTVRSLARWPEESYDIREVMKGFVATLTFKEMCTVLRNQKGWRPARDFFEWMKLQLCYRPSVIVYTIILRVYGEAGQIKLAEKIFLEMLDAGCEPDEVACGTMLCAYARWGYHKDMITFYDAIRQREIIPSVSVFNFMISSLQKLKLHGKAIQFWKQLLDAGLVPDQFTYTIAIRSYVKLDLLDEAFNVFHKMRKCNIIPEETSYSLLINATAKDGNWKQALNLYNDMKSKDILPSNYTCASLLTIYSKSGDYSEALSLFTVMARKKIPLDEVIYGILIRMYGKLGLHGDAEKTFEVAEKMGLFKDEKTYVTMVQVQLEAGKFDEALKTLDLMRSRNVPTTNVSLCALLRCYIAKRDVDSAETSFQSLYKFGKPDAISCHEMLTLYVRLNLLEKANVFISQLRNNQVQFDENLYRTVLQVYCKSGMVDNAVGLLREMMDSGMHLDIFTKTSLIAMYGGIGQTQRAEALFKTIDVPDLTALSVMLSLYIKRGDLQSKKILRSVLETEGGLTVAGQLIIKFVKEGEIVCAEALHRQVVELGHMIEDPTTASLISLYGKKQLLCQAENVFSILSDLPGTWSLSYCSMVETYVKCGEVDKANHLFRRMVNANAPLSPFIISILLNALTEDGKFEEAESIICDILRMGVELDAAAFNTCIKAMLEAGKLHFASRIYDQMVSLEIPRSIHTYSLMISVYGKGGKLDKAIEAFNTAQIMGIVLDEKVYTNMINYYGKAGKVEEASLLFCKMQSEGIKPGKICYIVMFTVYATAGLYTKAEELFERMHNEGHAPDSVCYLNLLCAYIKGDKHAQAEEIIRRMQRDGISPSHAHFNQLIFAYTRNGSITDAERVCNEMQQLGLSPDLTGCRRMLRAYLNLGLVDKGISFYQTIKGTVKRDEFALSAAVHLLEYAGKISEAREIIRFMDEHRILFLRSLKIGSQSNAGIDIS